MENSKVGSPWPMNKSNYLFRTLSPEELSKRNFENWKGEDIIVSNWYFTWLTAIEKLCTFFYLI